MLASEISRSLQLDDVLRAQGSASLADFADLLQRSPESTVESFLESRPPDERSLLAALIAIELRHRFNTGQACSIEDYLKRFPELASDGESVLDLIYAEYCERRQHDPTADVQDYYRRFPDYQNSLERLFHIDSLLQEELVAGEASQGELACLPDAGDMFLEFRLKAELGRGASGRVFLAEQETLSNRFVVLKVTPRETIEHRTLARLDHPNIVPILSVHHDELTGLHAVCMPYHCAVALSDVKPAWKGGRPFPETADAYLDALSAAIPTDRHTQSTARPEAAGYPTGKPFVYACAWIMQRIADALHHAHMRQVCHRDLKPSNILLSVSGQPLLVDFNLSFNAAESGGDSRAFFGGTLPYIPPEQIRALHPIEQGRPADVGPAADIYSLAATMFEVLTGALPFGVPKPGTDILTALQSQLECRSTIPSPRQLNPQVPVDLDALFQKCLDPVPHRRYESAAQLAEDLHRFLADKPLKNIPAGSLYLRMSKFLRRNRMRTGVATLILTAVIAMSTYGVRERNARGRAETQSIQLQVTAEKEADEALASIPVDAYKYFLLGRNYLSSRRYAHALRCFTRAIELRPDYAPAYYHRGKCYANLDKDADAISDYSKAISLDPSNLTPFLMRAVCYATSETHANPTAALADLQQVRERLPNESDESTKIVYLDIARAYSAVSVHIKSARERISAVELGEEFLLKALNQGLAVSYVKQLDEQDRYHMLKAVMEQPNVKTIISESTRSNRE